MSANEQRPSDRTQGIQAAVRRAQEDAAKRAERYGARIATVRDGLAVQVTPAEFRVLMNLPQ